MSDSDIYFMIFIILYDLYNPSEALSGQQKGSCLPCGPVKDLLNTETQIFDLLLF